MFYIGLYYILVIDVWKGIYVLINVLNIIYIYFEVIRNNKCIFVNVFGIFNNINEWFFFYNNNYYLILNCFCYVF